MNSKKAKQLRRAARQEMLEDPERELVARPKCEYGAINSPNSVRGFYLALKKSYGAAARTGFFSRKI